MTDGLINGTLRREHGPGEDGDEEGIGGGVGNGGRPRSRPPDRCSPGRDS